MMKFSFLVIIHSQLTRKMPIIGTLFWLNIIQNLNQLKESVDSFGSKFELDSWKISGVGVSKICWTSRSISLVVDSIPNDLVISSSSDTPPNGKD